MMKNNYIVYVHINKTNNKIYIGITRKKPERRWSNGSGYKQHSYFYNAIQRYGWEGFEHEIIASNLTEEEAKKFEVLLISKIPKEDRYNLTDGGDGCNGLKHSEETKLKISEAHKNMPEETRKRMSEAMSKAWKKRAPASEETKKRMSEFQKGKTFSKETRQKLSESAKARTSYPTKSINQYNLDGNLIRKWNSILEAAKQLNICGSHIVKVCKNKRKTAGGFKWEYMET